MQHRGVVAAQAKRFTKMYDSKNLRAVRMTNLSQYLFYVMNAISTFVRQMRRVWIHAIQLLMLKMELSKGLAVFSAVIGTAEK